jgi:hypothetical protein
MVNREAFMGKDKSIFEKITDKVKEITDIATQAADEALKADEPPDEPLAAYIPLAAVGFVSDPMMVPPLAVAPARQRRHAGLSQSRELAGRPQNHPAENRPGRSRGDLPANLPRDLRSSPPRNRPKNLQPADQAKRANKPQRKPTGNRQKKRARDVAEKYQAAARAKRSSSIPKTMPTP